MHLNPVQVAQLSAVFYWGRQMCFVEPCSVVSGRAWDFGFWLISRSIDGCWGCALLIWKDVLLSVVFEQHLLLIFVTGLWVGHFLIP